MLINIFIIAVDVNSLLIKYAGIRMPGEMAMMRGKLFYRAGYMDHLADQTYSSKKPFTTAKCIVMHVGTR